MFNVSLKTRPDPLSCPTTLESLAWAGAGLAKSVGADPKRRAADKSAEPKNCWGVVLLVVSEKGDFIPESEVEDDTISRGAELGVTNAIAESVVAKSKPKAVAALENPVDTFIVYVVGVCTVLLIS